MSTCPKFNGYTWQQEVVNAWAQPVPQAYQGYDVLNALAAMIPGIRTMTQSCPVCLNKLMLVDAIACLNDRHGWTREAIADWLETLDHDLTIKPAHTYEWAEAMYVPEKQWYTAFQTGFNGRKAPGTISTQRCRVIKCSCGWASTPGAQSERTAQIEYDLHKRSNT